MIGVDKETSEEALTEDRTEEGALAGDTATEVALTGDTTTEVALTGDTTTEVAVEWVVGQVEIISSFKWTSKLPFSGPLS